MATAWRSTLVNKTSQAPWLGWALWLGLSLLASLIILTGGSYPAQVFRSSLLEVSAGPLKVLSWFPQQLDLARENRELRKRATELFVETCRLREQAGEGIRLGELIGMNRRPELRYFPARVLARSSVFGPQSVLLDRGRRDGIQGGEALVTPWGLVGLLVEPGTRDSRALLLSHRDFRLRALLLKTREEGVLAGGAENLQLQDIPFSSPVAVGDTVVTSGAGSRFPGGLPVGIVSRVLESGGLFREVQVQPMVRLNSLEELFIVQSARPDSLAPAPAVNDSAGFRGGVAP